MMDWGEAFNRAAEMAEKARYRLFDDPDRDKHNKETLIAPNQDIIKDYMVNTGATFEEAMKWAAKQDAMNWNRFGAMPRNFIEKYRNKQALERDGIKRIN